MTTPTRLLPFAIALAFLAAGCSDCCEDGGGAPAEEPTTPAAAPDTTSDAATDTPSDAAPAAAVGPDGRPIVAATWRGDGRRLEFSAWEMGCSGCESTIRKRLGALDGVVSVDADKETSVVVVELEDGVDREALTAAITQALEQPGSGKVFEVIRAVP